MDKKAIASLGIILVGLVVLASATALFLYPYQPLHPPKVNSTGWTQQGVQQVVESNNQFAFKFYSELLKNDSASVDKFNGNIFYSPYSISSALAMTYEGARGKTAGEMKNVFQFPDYELLRPNFAKIYNDINGAHKDYTLRTGNALWVQKDFTLLSEYMKDVEEYYGGKASNLDFVNEPEKSRQTINNFIAEQTNNKIQNLIPKGIIDGYTRLVLTNAIYFKGTWKYEFNRRNTRDKDFKITPVQIVKVPMMDMKPKERGFNYADLGNLQILELPYKGSNLSMFIILPTINLSSIESNFTFDSLKDWQAAMRQVNLEEIEIPKFEFSTKYFMGRDLINLGMPSAFSGEADFSGMDGRKDLHIAAVIHQAYIKVDEKGTEAAAATAVVMKSMMAYPSHMRMKFIADHPFIFLIQDNKTGEILFMGRVVNPGK